MTRYLSLSLLFLCFSTVLSALGSKEKVNVVEVTGIIRLVGSSPFSELVITGPDKEWYVAKEDEHKLKDLQHKTVTVRGDETVVSLTFANGYPAGEKRTLKKIEIIAAE